MQPMIGLPSGLDRVRWKESASSPQPAMTPRMRRPARDGGLIAFQHQRAGAFRHHEAVAVLGKRLGRGGMRRLVLRRQRRQQRKADQASGLTEPSVATHSAASASPRRIASTPSWIALAPDAQAVDSEIGEPLVPKVSARWSATEPNRKRRW